MAMVRAPTKSTLPDAEFLTDDEAIELQADIDMYGEEDAAYFHYSGYHPGD